MIKITDITNKLPNKGSNGKRKNSDIVYAVIHHSGVFTVGNYNPLGRYVNEANYHISNPGKFGKRFAYTFTIDSKGNIYQCSPIDEMCYHAGNFMYNKNSFGICLDGSFERQNVPPAQLAGLKKLLDYLCTERPDMPKLVKNTIKFHGEVRLFGTLCPGKELAEFVKNYRK